MIIAYGGRNCWSFNEWMEINLRINKNVPSEYGFSDKSVVPALCFEGANASGKSSSLRVLSFIMDFALNSFFNTSPEITYDTFFNNNDESEFFLEFSLIGDVEKEYTYEMKIDKHTVFYERLYYKNKGKKEYIIKRSGNTIRFSTFDADTSNLILKSNASFISTFIQYGVPEIMPFKEFFSSIISNVSYTGNIETRLTDYVADFYYSHPGIHKKVCEKLKEFDTGIENIEILKGADQYGKSIYMSVFKHTAEIENSKLNYYSQSTGTQLLYNRLLDFFLTIENGGVLVFDELDCHLHSEIVPFLLEFFLDEDNNTKHAQLIFTSHDSELLDKMKKYRTYLFHKENGESICYRIDELPDNIGYRNDRPLSQKYRTGLIGGRPNV